MREPVIEFTGYRIENIDFRSYSKEEFEEVDLENGNISVGIGFTDDVSKAQIRLTATVIDHNLLRSVVVGISGQFALNCSEDEAQGYLMQNGVAILYPYIRSIISMITALDNDNTVVLPTINTSELK